MSSYPYMIALALIEQNGKRAIPLGGKSLKEPINETDEPGEIGECIAKELLLRILQRSENGPLRRSAGDLSLILIQIPMTNMQDQIPLIKSQWINSGNTEIFLEQLKEICERVWSLTFNKYTGTQYRIIKTI